jgi:hypothetical protein
LAREFAIDRKFAIGSPLLSHRPTDDGQQRGAAEKRYSTPSNESTGESIKEAQDLASRLPDSMFRHAWNEHRTPGLNWELAAVEAHQAGAGEHVIDFRRRVPVQAQPFAGLKLRHAAGDALDGVTPSEMKVRQRSRPRTGSSQPSCGASRSPSANGSTRSEIGFIRRLPKSSTRQRHWRPDQANARFPSCSASRSGFGGANGARFDALAAILSFQAFHGAHINLQPDGSRNQAIAIAAKASHRREERQTCVKPQLRRF